MEGIKFKAEKKVIGLMTGALGLYMTAAMWLEFNEALGFYLGAPMGIIIGTLTFMVYQSNKNVKEFTLDGDYSTSERTEIVTQADGRMLQVDGYMEPGRKPIMYVAVIYDINIILSELTWSNLII
jgi:uncharacterized membrane protein YhiD involved in acid resistance